MPRSEQTRCKFRLEALLIGPGYDQIDIGVLRRDPSKGVDKEIAPFLGVQARHKEKKASTADRRKSGVKGLEFILGISAGGMNPLGKKNRVPLIRNKAFFSKIGLQRTCKQDRGSIAQRGILNRPVEIFLNVLERIFVAEPGIERAVGKDDISLPCPACSEANGEGWKAPDALDDNAVEAMDVLAEPSPKSRGEGIASEPSLASSMDRTRKSGEPVRFR